MWTAQKTRQCDLVEVPVIPGDGIGPEVWAATREVLDAAVQGAYAGQRAIRWVEYLAGDAATQRGLPALPDETVAAIERCGVGIKGPTATPVGGGRRSVNVALRQVLDLFANLRPLRWIPGVATKVVDPQALDVAIFRENTEDVYGGIEFPCGSDGARRLTALLRDLGHVVPPDTESGLGVKVISRTATRRLVRAAIEWALAHHRRSVTVVHKGNIMHHTEGAFFRWAQELAQEEFSGQVVVGEPAWPDGWLPSGTVLLRHRIVDAAFQDLILRPETLDVIATPNLNGDYLSDACAARVGGLGLAPGANLGVDRAVFEAAHGTAPDLAGRDRANPGSMILSGALLLDYLGWSEAARRVESAVARVIGSGQMTADVSGGRDSVRVMGTREFGRAVALAAGASVQPSTTTMRLIPAGS